MRAADDRVLGAAAARAVYRSLSGNISGAARRCPSWFCHSYGRRAFIQGSPFALTPSYGRKPTIAQIEDHSQVVWRWSERWLLEGLAAGSDVELDADLLTPDVEGPATRSEVYVGAHHVRTRTEVVVDDRVLGTETLDVLG